MNQDELRIDSLVIHGGQTPDPITGAVMPPVSLSSTYAQQSPGGTRGTSTRAATTRRRYAFERCMAPLDGSTLTEAEDVTFGGFAFASGLAATATALELLDDGTT